MNSLVEIKNIGVQAVVEKYKLKSQVKGDLVILNYDQIDSPRKDPVSDECRGLVVSSGGNLVARSFKRFYNLGEQSADETNFNWSKSFSTTKVDGSLIIIYFYNGEWRINTRGSFGDSEICTDCGFTWSSLVKSLVSVEKLNPQYTYVAELCSRYNKVVVDYPTPCVYILSAFDGENELSFDEAVELTENCGFEVPEVNVFASAKDVLDYIELMQKQYAGGWEGVVLRDNENRRIKVKNPLYVALHHIKDNGNIFNPKRIVPFIMANEIDEVISYFPELKEKVEEYRAKIDAAWNRIDNFWFCYHDEPSQKKFAIAAQKDLGNLSSVVFKARKLKVEPKECFDVDTVLNLLF